MGKTLDEQGEAELQRITDNHKIFKAIDDALSPILGGQWAVLAGPTDKAEEHQGLVDALNRGEIEERERGMSLADLEDIFERLGIDKKLEDIKPDIERCKRLYGFYAAPLLKDEDLASLKKVIEFIECIDEP